MALGIHARPWLSYAAAAVAALMVGALVAVAPKLAIAAVALVAVTALAFVAPVFHLTLLLAITLIVPFEFPTPTASAARTRRGS